MLGRLSSARLGRVLKRSLQKEQENKMAGRFTDKVEILDDVRNAVVALDAGGADFVASADERDGDVLWSDDAAPRETTAS